MRKPKLLIFLIVSGLISGRIAANLTDGDIITANSLSGLAIGAGILLWLIIAYHLE